MAILGLDIGGANLKAANTAGWSSSRPFHLWREPERLREALGQWLADAPAFSRVALTMTGELADCFQTKAQGVRFICGAVREFAAARPVSVYATGGQFQTLEEACEHPLAAAASNWHALASYVAQAFAIEHGLLMDLGSTTCDIIPLRQRNVAACGKTDTQRLISGELVYTGVVRSPICAIVSALPYRGAWCPTAQELFATAGDAYLVLRLIEEDPSDASTADGRPATRQGARDRLARSICADRETFSPADATIAAHAIKAAQVEALASAARKVVSAMPEAPRTIVLSGQGEFLLREVWQSVGKHRVADAIPAEVVALSEKFGPHLSRCAPAYAVAWLAERQL
jgi:probable H4MPT-linked C1 transfer pathway protein